VPNFAQIDEEICKVRVEIYLHAQVKYDCHCVDLYEIDAYWTTVYKEFLYRILYKRVDQLSNG